MSKKAFFSFTSKKGCDRSEYQKEIKRKKELKKALQVQAKALTTILSKSYIGSETATKILACLVQGLSFFL